MGICNAHFCGVKTNLRLYSKAICPGHWRELLVGKQNGFKPPQNELSRA